VRKCLAKDPEERYQTIKDTALDLKEVVREIESEAALEQTVVPPAPQGAVSGADNIQRAPSSADRSAPMSTGETGRATTSSAEYIFGELKRHKWGVVLMLAVLLMVAAGAMVLRSRRAAAMTEKDTILLADFVNTTGDGIFDGTLKQALAVQLGQSPFLNIFPEQGVRDTLQYMNRSPDERVTRDVAREICERQGLKAMLTGSIANLGSHYVITLEALNGRTGETIAREQSEADSKEQVLRTLGQAATKLREKLGESLGSIQKFNAPIEEATTSSLEALKAYSQGREDSARGEDTHSVQFYNRAIELDPNFASAYVALAVYFYNSGQPRLAAEHAQKAFDLRERVSEREKLRVSSFYYTLVTGELDKAGEVLTIATQTYPRDPVSHINLANLYLITGQFDKAMDESREAIRLDPNQVTSKVNLGLAFIGLNRFPEAREVFERALEQKLEAMDFHTGLYQVAFINQDSQAMKRQIDLMNNGPDRYVGLDWQAQNASFGGQLQRAREFSRSAIDIAVSSNVKEVAARYTAEGALRNATFGKCQQTKAEAAHALAIERNPVSMTRSALALALCGDSAQTQQVIDDLSKRYPKDTLVNALWLPIIRAVLELNRNNLGQAGELLETTKRYEAVGEFWPNYLRGLTYLRQHMGAEAAGEFQKILDHRGQAPMSYLYPLSRLGLGRSMGLAGDKLASQKAYQDFLAVWKDADMDLPVYQEARKEYEGLR
jgi:eukaryotic-like serine/threonine-protein kinase